MKLLKIFIISSIFILGSCNSSLKDKINNSSSSSFNFSDSNSFIYFDFDSYFIKTSSKKFILDNVVKSLKNNAKISIIIQAHTDEIGTRSYNYKLGKKRANSIKNYLIDNNIKSSRIKIVSYGETRPVDRSSNKKAWKQNRRAVIIFK